MREKILVTGGAGFIGSHLVDAFISDGHDVIVVDNLHTGTVENIHPAARLHRADIRDVDALDQIFAAEQPAVVVHQAALADVRASLVDPAGYAAVNVIGTLHVLEAARKYGIRKVLFASTGGAIYGNPAECPATEACPAHPLDPYGVSKLACEHYLDSYHHNFHLEYCALRYSNVYGPRQDPQGEAGVVAIFTGKMLKGEQAIVNGDGTQRRDFTYVEDIARANLAALTRGSGIYNLGSGVGTDINTIYEHLAALTAYRRAKVHAPAKLGEVHTIFLDASRARRELGWEPCVALAEGLARTTMYFQKASAFG